MSDATFPVTGVSVVDLFCGAGGLSYGFRREGFPVAAGVDLDEACRYPYETNNQAVFLGQDIAVLDSRSVQALFPPGDLKILMGCAPCQPFSPYNRKRDHTQWRLLHGFQVLIRDLGPEIVSMENVPRLLNFRQGTLFRDFRQALCHAGYDVQWKILFGPDFGLPQKRHRLVLLASRLGPIAMPEATHVPEQYVTVEDAIRGLPRLKAGGIDPHDALHRASHLSDLNMKRIRASKQGGTWLDWPEEIVAPCHRKETGRTFSAVYGRMLWQSPAPTLTTQFFRYGTGRFGHPEQDRALSLREGAVLQGFPVQYAFTPADGTASLYILGCMIGNAVPIHIARAIARAIKSHLKEYA